jgi:chromosome segregation ATPase
MSPEIADGRPRTSNALTAAHEARVKPNELERQLADLRTQIVKEQQRGSEICMDWNRKVEQLERLNCTLQETITETSRQHQKLIGEKLELERQLAEHSNKAASENPVASPAPEE